jgi:hypothetical protein
VVPPVGRSMERSWRSCPGCSSVSSWMRPCTIRSAGSNGQAGRWSSRAKDGWVEGGSVDEEIELGLTGGPSPIAGQAIEDIFEDQAVVNHEGLGDRAGRGGEIAAEGDHNGIGGQDAAIEQLGHASGVGGGDPERAQGRGLWGWVGGRGEFPGAGGALPEGGRGVRRDAGG